jgi:hypothetical protein
MTALSHSRVSTSIVTAAVIAATAVMAVLVSLLAIMCNVLIAYCIVSRMSQPCSVWLVVN